MFPGIKVSGADRDIFKERMKRQSWKEVAPPPPLDLPMNNIIGVGSGGGVSKPPFQSFCSISN